MGGKLAMMCVLVVVGVRVEWCICWSVKRTIRAGVVLVEMDVRA